MAIRNYFSLFEVGPDGTYIPIAMNGVTTSWWVATITVPDRDPVPGSQGDIAFVTAELTDDQHNIARLKTGVQYIPLEDTLGNPLTLEDTVGDVDPTNRGLMQAFFEARHIPTDGIGLGDTLRDALTQIVKRFLMRQVLGTVDFNIVPLDNIVSSIPVATRQQIAARLAALGVDFSNIQGTDTIRTAIRKVYSQLNVTLPVVNT